MRSFDLHHLFVRFLSLALLCGAMAVLGVITVWPVIAGWLGTDASGAGGLVVRTASFEGEPDAFTSGNVAFSGYDADARPVNITSEAVALLPDADPEQRADFALRAPVANLQLPDGRSVGLRAPAGQLSDDGQNLTLTGGVTGDDSAEIKFDATDLSVDFANSSVRTQSPVSGSNERGRFEGEGMSVENNGAVVRLTGRSKLVILPETETGADAAAAGTSDP